MTDALRYASVGLFRLITTDEYSHEVSIDDADT